jgi:Rho GTPase-activating protein 10
LRETHENEQEKAYHLKAQVIEEGQHGMVHHPEFVKQGIVLILDKKKRAGEREREEEEEEGE